MEFSTLNVELRRHAVLRAIQRGVTPGMIEATIKGGRVFSHGKNRLKFVKQYKRCKVICVDHLVENRIVIVTIEVKT